MHDQPNFEKLKEVLAGFPSGLTLKKDHPDYYYLNTNRSVKNKEMFFGAVQNSQDLCGLPPLPGVYQS